MAASAAGSRPGFRLKNKPRVPLERALSKLGLASRTQARSLIEAGRVKVHGKVQTDPLFGVTPETAAIVIDGVAARPRERQVLILHKTRGVLTTREDERGRKTIFDLLPGHYLETGHLHAVGRLDQATTGLILLTNDTRLSAWLTDPKSEIERTYLVTVRGEVTPLEIKKILQGVDSEVGRIAARAAELRKTSSRESHLVVTLDEGKNREIRRLFEALGHEVTALKRISYGALELGTLAPGEVIEVAEDELEAAFPEMPRSTTLKKA